MMLNIPVGISDFAEIRQRGYYYIDKTALVRELLKTTGTKVTLITRPRRFGKTLGMSMLAHFFDIRRDSSRIFEGLDITSEKKLCKEWMNQYPTIFLTFKDIDGLNFLAARRMLQNRIADLYNEHSYLAKSDKVNDNDRKIFAELSDIVEGRPTEDLLKTSISTLMKMMAAYYDKSVIVILDEYDVPLAKANSHGYYEEMLDLMKTMMSMALKDNNNLEFAVVTGCLKISKESIFTGVNNFTTDTISNNRYNEFFGFTQNEVEELLKRVGHTEKLDIIRQWYDGYRFGNMDIYCPWDVLNYVMKLLAEGETKPGNFWEHTSDNAVIGEFLERTDFDVTEKFEMLLNGGYIKECVNENLTYDFLASSEENLWSLLYLTGYLTKTKEEELKAGDYLEERQTALKIPNAEVMDIFRKSVVEWFNKKSAKSDRRELFWAMWNGEEKLLTELLSDLLFDTISYHDYAESYYHAFIAGLVSNAGYIVESNYENGLGRADVVLKDRSKRRAIVIEVKIADAEDMMERECIDALNQIEEKQYARKIERDGFRTVIRYGIAFYRKECMVRRG
ncbi:AAA family ATPase [Blautia obeum]|uniref:AAA family ATPase n=1 Tax=Blautia obeum TaxID=40520 RepID=UPI003D07D19C